MTTTSLSITKDITASNKDETQKVVPGIGKFLVYQIEGQAGFDINVKVEIIFGTEILWITKGAMKSDRRITGTGDGVKELKLSLNAVDLPSGSVTLGLSCKVRHV